VISGLKLAQTGDTLLLSKSIASAIEANMDPDDNVSNAALCGPAVPDPVVFCSVEPPSLAEQKQFELALTCLSREDPSLKVTQDDETGQTDRVAWGSYTWKSSEIECCPLTRLR